MNAPIQSNTKINYSLTVKTWEKINTRLKTPMKMAKEMAESSWDNNNYKKCSHNFRNRISYLSGTNYYTSKWLKVPEWKSVCIIKIM